MEYSSAKLKKIIIALSVRTAIILAAAIAFRIFFGGLIIKESEALYNERTLSNIVLERQANVEKLEKSYKEVKDDIANMEAAVPSERRIFEIVRLFETLARDSGGTAAVSFSDPQNKTETLVEIPFHFIVSGNVDFLENYLKKLEGLPYGIKFLSLNVAGPAGVYNNSEARIEAAAAFRAE